MGNCDGKICPVCQGEIRSEEALRVCPECGVPHHESCWTSNGGCSTPGCASQVAAQTAVREPAAVSAANEVPRQASAPQWSQQPIVNGAGVQPTVSSASICSGCGAVMGAGETFCTKCGQKAGLEVNPELNAAIGQYNSQVAKGGKKKKNIVLISVILAVVLAVVGVGVGIAVHQKNKEEAIAQYREDAEQFMEDFLYSAANLETIGNEIHEAWEAYVTSSYYNYSRLYSVDGAISAAQSTMSSEIAEAKGDDSGLVALYGNLKEVPDEDDPELMEIKEAVDEAYEAYRDMYECVINPSGSYNSWTDEYSDVHSRVVDAYEVLEEIFK